MKSRILEFVHSYLILQFDIGILRFNALYRREYGFEHLIFGFRFYLSPLFPFSKNKPDGRPVQPQPFSKLVGDVPFISEMDALRIICKANKSWRRCRHLCGIIELYAPPTVGRGLMSVNDSFKCSV